MIRHATVDDACTLARMRQAMAAEMQPSAQTDPSFRERTFGYWYEMFVAQKAVGWIAEVDGAAIGMASLLLHHHPPIPFGERRRGYVHGVYVAPEYRRQGHGRALMDAVIAYAREHGLQRLELKTSDAGRSLYSGLGFEPYEILILRLDKGLST